MTRAHARLLGPCFKTGPESTQSNSVADKRVLGHGSRDTSPTVERLQYRHTKSDSQITARAFDAPNANGSRSSAAFNTVGQVRRDTTGSKRNETKRSPPRALDGHPTGRDVLLREKCTRTATDRTPRAQKHSKVNPSLRDASPSRRHAESLFSNFRVSQVYP